MIANKIRLLQWLKLKGKATFCPPQAEKDFTLKNKQTLIEKANTSIFTRAETIPQANKTQN